MERHSLHVSSSLQTTEHVLAQNNSHITLWDCLQHFSEAEVGVLDGAWVTLSRIAAVTIPENSMTTLIQTMWHSQKNRSFYQESKTESPEIDPYKYSQLIFDSGA